EEDLERVGLALLVEVAEPRRELRLRRRDVATGDAEAFGRQGPLAPDGGRLRRQAVESRARLREPAVEGVEPEERVVRARREGRVLRAERLGSLEERRRRVRASRGRQRDREQPAEEHRERLRRQQAWGAMAHGAAP